MNIVVLIEQKIAEGKKILEGLSTMRERSGMAINVTYYVAEDVQSAIRKMNKWQLTCKEILIYRFGESHRHTASFVETITAKNSGFNYRREFEHEMNEGLSVLEGISESLSLGLDGTNYAVNENSEGVKPPLVFISHAEADKKFANEIITLFEFIGVKGKEKLLCTSVDGYRIPLGRDIIEYLRDTFNKYNLFVIILHTHNYYIRPVCMNEMGAAWALKTKYFSVLAPDFSFNEMTGVVNSKDIAIKIGADDCEARINQLKNELVDFFGLPQPDEDRWPYYRSSFIENCLKYKSCKKNKTSLRETIEPASTDGLIALSHSFKIFEDGDGCYPFQIDVKFAAQNEDVYFKSLRLTNKRRFVELDGYGAINDTLYLRKYLKPNVLNIEYSKNANYSHLVEENYQTSAIYVEDHKLSKKALETMSFHGIIGLRRQMDGYDDFKLDGWELHVFYNMQGELVIPLKTIIL
jgi:hypothetical protein